MNLTVRSATETSMVGVRRAMPVNMPLTAGVTVLSALAEPVEDMMMLLGLAVYSPVLLGTAANR